MVPLGLRLLDVDSSHVWLQRYISLCELPLTIGRKGDVVVDCLTPFVVSSVHCVFSVVDDVVTVEDRSTRGTFLNQRRLVKGAKSSIMVGDVIRLVREVTYRVVAGVVPPPPLPAAPESSLHALLRQPPRCWLSGRVCDTVATLGLELVSWVPPLSSPTARTLQALLTRCGVDDAAASAVVGAPNAAFVGLRMCGSGGGASVCTPRYMSGMEGGGDTTSADVVGGLNNDGELFVSGVVCPRDALREACGGGGGGVGLVAVVVVNESWPSLADEVSALGVVGSLRGLGLEALLVAVVSFLSARRGDGQLVMKSSADVDGVAPLLGFSRVGVGVLEALKVPPPYGVMGEGEDAVSSTWLVLAADETPVRAPTPSDEDVCVFSQSAFEALARRFDASLLPHRRKQRALPGADVWLRVMEASVVDGAGCSASFTVGSDVDVSGVSFPTLREGADRCGGAQWSAARNVATYVASVWVNAWKRAVEVRRTMGGTRNVPVPSSSSVVMAGGGGMSTPTTPLVNSSRSVVSGAGALPLGAVMRVCSSVAAVEALVAVHTALLGASLWFVGGCGEGTVAALLDGHQLRDSGVGATSRGSGLLCCACTVVEAVSKVAGGGGCEAVVELWAAAAEAAVVCLRGGGLMRGLQSQLASWDVPVRRGGGRGAAVQQLSECAARLHTLLAKCEGGCRGDSVTTVAAFVLDRFVPALAAATAPYTPWDAVQHLTQRCAWVLEIDGRGSPQG